MTATLSYRVHLNGYPYLASYDPANQVIHLWKEDTSLPMPLHLILPLDQLTALHEFIQSRVQSYAEWSQTHD